MRRKLVAGNWKMNGSLAGNEALLRALVAGLPGTGAEVAVCAPYPYLEQCARLLAGSRIALGAQDCSQHDHGAYTGEVAAAMLRELGCRYVILGHSERRTLHGETDELVAEKVSAALASGLEPIVCVGESLAERESGVTEKVIARQLDAVIARCGIAAFGRLVVAYEPLWAIGTGRTASPDQAQAVHAFIRGRIARHDAQIASSLIIQYGGSVKAGNAGELFAQPDIDGGLIGGASLLAGDFIAIVKAAA
ncbi:MAG: triose-phosphate isomerase [Rhodocyclaceae bacterium]